MSSKPGTLSCVLCGGTHIYPGPRFLNHLINTHGILQNLEYIIQASQYKDTYSRLPPLTQQSSKPSNNQTTQTQETLPPIQCNRCHPPSDTFLTSTPIRQNSYQRSSQFQVSTSARSLSVISQIRHQQPKKEASSECKQEVSLQEDANVTATETEEVKNSITGDLPARSGFRCVCALCSWVTTDDTTFWTHITKKHKMNFQLYKAEHGLCQIPTGSGKYKCLLCQTVTKYMPGIIDKHLRSRHQMSWIQYLYWIKEDRMKSFHHQHVDDGLAAKSKIKSVAKKVVEDSQPLITSEQSVKNFRPMNIRDKTTKHCTHCKLTFPSRNLFLVHCQQVHKLRFKSKSGGSLSFQQSGFSSAAVAFNKSAHHLPTSTPMSHSLGIPVSRYLQQCPSSHPRKMSSSMTVKTVSCRYCHKVFASVSNRDRHVRLNCKGAAGDELEVNEVQNEEMVEGGEDGFKCNKCGRLFSKLGNLNRHYLNICIKQSNQ